MIEILSCGPLTTIQDRGRSGARALGIGPCGAMDVLALRAGNVLLGNDQGAAGIETAGAPCRIRFATETPVAVTGAVGPVILDGVSLPPWWSITAGAGQELVVSPARAGVRTYITVAGGIDTPAVLGSRSTDLKAGLGGLEGRALKPGDRLPLGRRVSRVVIPRKGYGASMPDFVRRLYTDEVIVLRVIPAAQQSMLTGEALQLFYRASWLVTKDSNRLGLRLQGPPLARRAECELLSHPIIPGTIQLPPGGQPIIQACDANTCGGYPKIAVVIQADLFRLAQLRSQARIQFSVVEEAEALRAAAEIETYLRRFELYVRLVREPAVISKGAGADGGGAPSIPQNEAAGSSAQ